MQLENRCGKGMPLLMMLQLVLQSRDETTTKTTRRLCVHRERALSISLNALRCLLKCMKYFQKQCPLGLALCSCCCRCLWDSHSSNNNPTESNWLCLMPKHAIAILKAKRECSEMEGEKKRERKREGEIEWEGSAHGLLATCNICRWSLCCCCCCCCCLLFAHLATSCWAVKICLLTTFVAPPARATTTAPTTTTPNNLSSLSSAACIRPNMFTRHQQLFSSRSCFPFRFLTATFAFSSSFCCPHPFCGCFT